MNRVLFLTIWPVEKMGRHQSSRVAMCRRVDVANTLHKLWPTSAPDCSPHHHWKTTVFDSWLQSVQRELLTGKSPDPYVSTVRKLSKLGVIWKKNDRLPKLQRFVGHLVSPLLPPLNVGWSKKRFSPSCSPILAQLMKVLHGSSWANLDLLYNICCIATGSFLKGPLNSSKTPFWGPRSTRKEAVDSLPSLVNCTITRLTVESRMPRFWDICRWLTPPSDWPTVHPLWK